MPAQIEDGGFETGAPWSFNGAARRAVSGSDDGATLFPHTGSAMAELDMRSVDPACGGLVQGSVSQNFTVALGDEGYYLVRFYQMWPDIAPWGFDIPDVLIDGVSLTATIGVTVDGDPFHIWTDGEGNFGSGFYLAPGAHTIELRAIGLTNDIDGNLAPCSAVRPIWFDDVSLVASESGVVLPGTAPPRPELIRLTHAPGAERVRFTVRAGRTARLVHHG